MPNTSLPDGLSAYAHPMVCGWCLSPLSACAQPMFRDWCLVWVCIKINSLFSSTNHGPCGVRIGTKAIRQGGVGHGGDIAVVSVYTPPYSI